MTAFIMHRRKGEVWLKPYEGPADLVGVSVSRVDDPETDRGYIAMNPDNIEDLWYVARAYYEKNYEVAV